MNRLSTMWKAVVGFVAPGAVLIGAAVLPDSEAGSAITGAEAVRAVVAMVVTAAGVYAASNAPKVDDNAEQEEPLDDKAEALDTPLGDIDRYIGEHEAGR